MIMEVRNLSFQYHNSRTIFSDVNFDIDQGEVLSIIGINGAGKSTLLNCLAALFSPKTERTVMKPCGAPFLLYPRSML